MCLAIYTRYLLVFKQFICLAASAVAHLLVIYLVFTVFFLSVFIVIYGCQGWLGFGIAG